MKLYNGLADAVLLTLLGTPFVQVFDDTEIEETEETTEETEETTEDESGDGTNTQTKEKKPPGRPVKAVLKTPLTADQQAWVNQKLADERRAAKKAGEKLVAQLREAQSKAGLTDSEREAYETQIRDIRSGYTSKEELAKQDKERQKKDYESKLTKEKERGDKWEKMYKDSTITREITTASMNPKHKAHNPQHIVNELAPKTRLVEDTDEEGKPTGSYIPMVKLASKDKEGKAITLDLTVTDAVKWLSEQEEHAPLFESGATGGTGLRNSIKKGNGDSGAMPTDTASYIEKRKKMKEKGQW